MWGGETYPWSSWQIYLTGTFSAAMLATFVFVETQAEDPIVPLGLFKNSIFTISSVTLFIMGVAMFSTILYVTLFVQGVIGTSAMDSGTVLTSLGLSLVMMNAASGFLVSKIGRYKPVMLVGLAIMAAGMSLLTRLDADSTNAEVLQAVIVIGLGLGSVMQLFVLAIQNSVPRREMGVATSASTFFRQIGGTVGVTVLGALLASRLSTSVAENLPPGAANLSQEGRFVDLLGDPNTLAQLPPRVAEELRVSLAESLSAVFTVSFFLMVAALLLTLFLKEIPLRKTLDEEPETSVLSPPIEAGRGTP